MFHSQATDQVELDIILLVKQVHPFQMGHAACRALQLTGYFPEASPACVVQPVHRLAVLGSLRWGQHFTEAADNGSLAKNVLRSQPQWRPVFGAALGTYANLSSICGKNDITLPPPK